MSHLKSKYFPIFPWTLAAINKKQTGLMVDLGVHKNDVILG